MKNFIYRIPYLAATGAERGYSSEKSFQPTIWGLSPRINGRLQFRQNPYSASAISHDYTPFRQYISRTGLPGVVGPSQGFLFDASTSTHPGGYYVVPEGGYLDGGISATYSAHDEAMIRCLSQAGSFQANLLDMYRTRAETIDMITHRVLQLANAMLCLRRRNWRGACGALGINPRKPRSSLKDIPSCWLEYQYGWKPLVQDCYSLIDRPFPEPYKICKGSSRVSNTRVGFEGSNDPGMIGFNWQSSTSVRCTVRTKIFAKGSALAAASQVGITNPAALAWEALPFSFVVDWFLPVGNYLESMTATDGLAFSDAMRTTVSKRVVDGTYHSSSKTVDMIPGTQEGYTIFSASGKLHRSYLNKDRVFVEMTYPFPKFKSPLSLTHFANATSLLATAFSPSRKASRFT